MLNENVNKNIQVSSSSAQCFVWAYYIIVTLQCNMSDMSGISCVFQYGQLPAKDEDAMIIDG